jgi:hypothetical protein
MLRMPLKLRFYCWEPLAKDLLWRLVWFRMSGEVLFLLTNRELVFRETLPLFPFL